MRLLLPSQVCLLALAGVMLRGAGRSAVALPPAGTDLLALVATADVVSPLGEETVILTGWGLLDREAPRLEGGVEVIAAEIVRVELVGASSLGLVSAAERPNDGASYISAGDLRSLVAGQSFPASSFFDLFLDISVPASPLGSFRLYNDTAFHLAPRDAGQEVPLAAWPPVGVTYELAAGAGCIPLLGAAEIGLTDGFCVGNLALEFAPEQPSYSVARAGPLARHPADILALTPAKSDLQPAQMAQVPFVRIRCSDLGLTADGCDDGTDGDQDDLDALSYGADLSSSAPPRLSFSVGPGAQGVPGSAVEAQRACPPALPGASPEPEPDQFGSFLNGANFQVLDGNGPVGACSAAFPLGLIESASVRDDLDALDQQDGSAVDQDADGVPDSPVYISLDAASPSVGALGASAADVLVTSAGATPTVYASAAALGLQAGDDLDALCLRENGDGVYGPEDLLYYSLAPASPTLEQSGAGPADLLAPGRPPTVAQPAASLGLLERDDVNALACHALKGADADTDSDTVANASDPDDDNDGCTDQEELSSDASRGGGRQPHSFWDFFDTPDAANLRDGAVTMVDLFRVAARFGALGDPTIDPRSAPAPAPAYHTAFDRAPAPAGAGSLAIGAPDGAIVSGDVFAVAAQFGHACV